MTDPENPLVVRTDYPPITDKRWPEHKYPNLELHGFDTHPREPEDARWIYRVSWPMDGDESMIQTRYFGSRAEAVDLAGQLILDGIAVEGATFAAYGTKCWVGLPKPEPRP